jgi:NAD(P)-dependent dehydrogenase (short-subunit alcohol dehydrogenase family)
VGAAVVTGAGRGLGLEIAKLLAARGLAVNLTDVDATAAEEAAAAIGGMAWGGALDVRDEAACKATASAAIERAGSLDVWVNNAGVVVTGRTWEHDEETRKTILDVNAHGTFNGTLAALEPMRAAARGHIINIVSLAGLVAAPGEALYAASKHAAIAFTIGTLTDLRRSGEKGVRLSAVCPDGIWTPMLYDKLDDEDAAVSFGGALLLPEQVAEATVGLLDKPRVVLTVPRSRALLVRIADVFPRLAIRSLPLLLADARRKQRRWKERIERGEWP